MGKRITLTENEKTFIKNLYGIINEQSQYDFPSEIEICGAHNTGNDPGDKIWDIMTKLKDATKGFNDGLLSDWDEDKISEIILSIDNSVDINRLEDFLMCTMRVAEWKVSGKSPWDILYTMGWKKLGGLIGDVDGEDCNEVKIKLLGHIRRIGGTTDLISECGL